MNLIPLVKEYLSKGYDADQIALRLEISQKESKALVRKAISLIEQESGYKAEKALAMKRLDQLSIEAWEAWQQSKAGSDSKFPSGDGKFLGYALEINKERNKILGLTTQEKQEDGIADLFAQYLDLHPSQDREEVRRD